MGDGCGGITISLDCDDRDSSEVDGNGKLELTFFLLPQQHLTRQTVENTSIHEGC